MRKLNYLDAIREGIQQSMQKDKNVFVYGEGIEIASGPFGVPLNLEKEFGKKRIFDVPLSEAAMTGLAIGSAINNLKPIMIHFRLDFTLLTFDQLFNAAAKIHYMFGGKISCPLVIKATVGQGWGQGPNHSQAFHSIFAHFPGMKVVLPSNPYDAKGLMISAIQDKNPVLFLEHKQLFSSIGSVPKKFYSIKIGKGKVLHVGKDITLVGFSSTIPLMIDVSHKLKKQGISCEVIDLRSSFPLDKSIIINSVKKTGRIAIFDIDWSFAGVSSEICAIVGEYDYKILKSNFVRITPPHVTHPVSYSLEKYFYPNLNFSLKKISKIIK
jgi:pyruvate dehydrogenase E1 component beta subunit